MTADGASASGCALEAMTESAVVTKVAASHLERRAGVATGHLEELLVARRLSAVTSRTVLPRLGVPTMSSATLALGTFAFGLALALFIVSSFILSFAFAFVCRLGPVVFLRLRLFDVD